MEGWLDLKQHTRNTIKDGTSGVKENGDDIARLAHNLERDVIDKVTQTSLRVVSGDPV